MTREEVYKEIEGMFGLVPSFFRDIPDSSLELEWKLMKTLELEDGPIPNKYRELIGLGVSAATKCHYCTLFHTEIAKLFGATDEEIQSAAQFAKHTSGWSTYVNAIQLPYDQFKSEIEQAVAYVRSKQIAVTA